MNDLLRSEWRRFRRFAMAIGLCHGLILLLLSRVVDVPQLGYQEHGFMLTLYMALGLALALLQVGSYRQASRWLWLIHRPLAPARIFAALALAALTQLAVAILAPLLLFLLATQALTTHVVDTRHYVAAFYALAFAMMAWMAGAHACTSRHKVAVAVLLAPLLLALHLASVWQLLPLVLLCLAWLTWIARHSFRADRDAPIARHGVLLLTALPLQIAFLLILFQLTKGGLEVANQIVSGPGHTVLASDPQVDVDAQTRSFSQRFLAAGLKASNDPRAALWREQLPMLEPAELVPDIERFPVRNQISNLGQQWWDEQRNIAWTFSHDRMQFLGRDPVTGTRVGHWGVAGFGSAQPFAHVPLSTMTRDTLYTVDDDSQRQYLGVHLPAGEWFVARPKQALGRELLLTNRRLLAYRPDRQSLTPFAPPTLDWQLPLAAGELPPVEVDVVQMLDGWLVSLFYDNAAEYDGFETLLDPWQQLVFIDARGHSTVIGERHGIHDHQVVMGGGSLLPQASWWLSPPLYVLVHLPSLMLDTGLTQPVPWLVLPRSPLFHWLALALLLAALAAAHFWLRRTRADPVRRSVWLGSCALLGLPALLSLMCLEPRIPRS